MTKISCLMAAYNEEPRIKNILSVVASHPMVDEMIVVDDCSKDKTVEVIRSLMASNPKIRLIVQEKNQGKTRAIWRGIKESTGDYLMLIDADLVGITENDITNLIEPVLSGTVDVTISLRRNAPRVWHMIGIDYISGERVMPRQFLLGIVDDLPKLPKFGLEAYMNKFMIQNKFRIKIVNWPNVDSPYKITKMRSLWKGITADVIMVLQILKTVGVFAPITQIISMRKMMVK